VEVKTMGIQRTVAVSGIMLMSLLAAGVIVNGQTPAPESVQVPGTATLEGLPAVRVDLNADRTTRQVLGQAEAAKNRLMIRVRDGRYFWAGREDEPLRVWSSGAFTYLASSEPGHYVRFTRLNDKITYAEHVDSGLRSVTYFGELKIVLDR
jgi:hypothetical protein